MIAGENGILILHHVMMMLYIRGKWYFNITSRDSRRKWNFNITSRYTSGENGILILHYFITGENGILILHHVKKEEKMVF